MLIDLFVVSVGGLLLHLHFHPLGTDYAWVPFAAGLLTASLILVLFAFDRTIEYAYVLNGMFVVIGTITMIHYSIVHFPGDHRLISVLTNTLLPEILVMWTNFGIGKVLLEMKERDLAKPHTERPFRYPGMTWWALHLVLMSGVYSLGRILWK